MRRLGFIVYAFALASLGSSIRAATVVPDFHLEDANDESVRFETMVSPRDYVLQVTGFYFGHAG
jgi:hypothetical protein